MAEPPAHHRILERQLRRLGLSDDAPPTREQWSRLLDVVSSAYQEADAERYTMERSVEISSTEMRQLHDGLTHQATHDSLTGLPNRVALTEFLTEALAEQRYAGGDIAILFIDLDDFKLINDSLGHSAGDELLGMVAERICASVRQQDVVARLGGDEFVVACVGIDSPDLAIAIAQRMAARLESPFRIADHDNVVSASIGIAFSGGRTASDDLLREADMAMYEAKTQGRSRYVIFDDEMRRRVEGRLATENALRYAVDRNEFRLVYQPIIALADGRLLAVEALLRWNRPGHGIVMPSAFIPIAEQSRLITNIDAWVIRTACEQTARWRDHDIAVAINLTARDLQRADIVSTISAALGRVSLPPDRLILEITETTLVSDDTTIAASLARARMLGVQLAIDDFGTGYSSFSTLRQLPAQTLKIDRSFVSRLDQGDATSDAIVTAIITMGHALGLRVVAEGVERMDQAAHLRRLGCDAAQGFAFSPPLNAATLERILREEAVHGPMYWQGVAERLSEPAGLATPVSG